MASGALLGGTLGSKGGIGGGLVGIELGRKAGKHAGEIAEEISDAFTDNKTDISIEIGTHNLMEQIKQIEDNIERVLKPAVEAARIKNEKAMDALQLCKVSRK